MFAAELEALASMSTAIQMLGLWVAVRKEEPVLGQSAVILQMDTRHVQMRPTEDAVSQALAARALDVSSSTQLVSVSR